MDRAFDFRALLLQIQNRLSNDDRRRLHFLIGDIIPRHQREDCTLGGTLTLLESLFDRALISEDYLEFLVRIFKEIQCHDAVRRLQEYQASRVLKIPKPTQLDIILDDNIEEDKMGTHFMRATSDRFRQPETGAAEYLEQSPNEALKRMHFFSSPLTVLLCVLLFLQIISLGIFFIVHFEQDAQKLIRQRSIRREAMRIFDGKKPDVEFTGTWSPHTKNLSLTYNDLLKSIGATYFQDELLYLKFTYNQNKVITHQLKNLSRRHINHHAFKELKEYDSLELTQCFNRVSIKVQLVGLIIGISNDSTLFGSCFERHKTSDEQYDAKIAYVKVNSDDYLQGMQFVWYKNCPLEDEVTPCFGELDTSITLSKPIQA